MRARQFSKKLTLNKKTIAHLSNEELNIINGGYNTMPQPCPSYPVCHVSDFHEETCKCVSIDCVKTIACLKTDTC